MEEARFHGPQGLRWMAFTFLGRPIRKILYVLMRTVDFINSWTHFAFEQFVHHMNRALLEDVLTDHEIKAMAGLQKYFYYLKFRVAKIQPAPLISVVVPVYKAEIPHLKEMLESVAFQVYENWQLCICDDASGDPEITKTIEAFKARFPGKVKFLTNPKNRHISYTSNRCLSVADGEYVALLDHDDRLLPNALAEMVRFIDNNDYPDVLYSDERVVNASGSHLTTPFYKPGWSPLLHLSVNYTTHFSVYRRSILQEVGGFREGFEGSQDHDLMLRVTEATKKPVVHVPFCLYQWRATEQSTANSLDNKSYAVDAGIKAVQEACDRRGWPADVSFERETLHYRIKFKLPDQLPKISIVIPSKDGVELIRTCIDSIVELSTYPDYEIVVVDNGSVQPATHQFYEQTKGRLGERFRLVVDENPFNFAELNNKGVAAAQGEYVVLLNNDTKIVTPNWLEEMLSLAQFEHVGAVGAKLLYEDDTIQHGGVVLLDRAIGGHSYRHLDHDTPRYMNFCHTLHEATAVTAACMMISKKDYLSVDGLDEIFVPNGYGDVDFCLKLKDRGLTHVYTPYAKLYHYESKTRGSEIENFERNYMIQSWGQQLMNDPYFNFNLSRCEGYMPGGVPAIDPTKSMFDALLSDPKFRPGTQVSYSVPEN